MVKGNDHAKGEGSPAVRKGSGKSSVGSSSSSAKSGGEARKRKKLAAKSNAAKVKGPVSISKFTSDLASTAKPWYQEFGELPGWLTAISLTVAIVSALSPIMCERLTHTEDIEAIMLKAFGDERNGTILGDLDVFLLYCIVNNIPIKRVKEVIKLLKGFSTIEDYGACFVKAFNDQGEAPTHDSEVMAVSFLNLASAKSGVLKALREAQKDLRNKAAKVPPEVLSLEKEIQAFSRVLKDEDKRRRDAIAAQRDILKKMIADDDKAKKDTQDIRDLIKDFYDMRSGSLSTKQLAKLTTYYHKNANIRELYTLAQFQSLYANEHGAAKVAQCVQKFLGNPAFQKAQDYIKPKVLEDMDVGGEEVDDDGDDGDLDSSVLANLSKGL